MDALPRTPSVGSLADAAATIDDEQQRLAVEFARLRRELAEIRELLWPSEVGHAFHKTRRPGIAGPAAR